MDKIFVAIASYRDIECQWTVHDLFERAKYPERIQVGICWQFDSEIDQNCFEVPYTYPNQVQVKNYSLNESKGACWAKSDALSMMTDEKYTLLIDSHMRFENNWDENIIYMLSNIPDMKAFISTYPAEYIPPNTVMPATPMIIPTKFEDGIPAFEPSIVNIDLPMKSFFVAGGFIFGLSKMFKEVPYDPNIYFLGEEIIHAIRFFTHGWTSYTPHKCLLYHYYTRKSDKKHWDDDSDWVSLNDISYQRVKHLLKIEKASNEKSLVDIEKYSLGEERSLEEFQLETGIYFRSHYINKNRYKSMT